MIDCCPGLYSTFRDVQRTRQGTGYVSHGYERQADSSAAGIALKNVKTSAVRSATGRASASYWKDHTTSSEAELAVKSGDIYVTTTVNVQDADEFVHAGRIGHAR